MNAFDYWFDYIVRNGRFQKEENAMQWIFFMKRGRCIARWFYDIGYKEIITSSYEKDDSDWIYSGDSSEDFNCYFKGDEVLKELTSMPAILVSHPRQ